MGDICEEIPESATKADAGEYTSEHHDKAHPGGASESSEGKAVVEHALEAGHADDDQGGSVSSEPGAAEISRVREGKAVAADAGKAHRCDKESDTAPAAAEDAPKGAEKRDEGTLAAPPPSPRLRGAHLWCVLPRSPRWCTHRR